MVSNVSKEKSHIIILDGLKADGSGKATIIGEVEVLLGLARCIPDLGSLSSL